MLRLDLRSKYPSHLILVTHWSDPPPVSSTAAAARVVLLLPMPLPLLLPKGVECPWPNTMSPPLLFAFEAAAAAGRAGAGALTAVRLITRDGGGAGGGAAPAACPSISRVCALALRSTR